jgi:hypothetical protein
MPSDRSVKLGMPSAQQKAAEIATSQMAAAALREQQVVQIQKLLPKLTDAERAMLRDQLLKDEFNGPLQEIARNGPENERNPIEHPELAYRRGYQQGAHHVVAALEKADALSPALLSVLEDYLTTVAFWRYPRGDRRRLRCHLLKDRAPELNLDRVKRCVR